MRIAALKLKRALLIALSLLLTLGGCATLQQKQSSAPTEVRPPIRFLLTFDDGPSIKRTDNPTLSILRQLADNDVQPGIKALFFVQTRNYNGGGSQRGQSILAQTHAAGHVLGVHSGSLLGHIGHRWMTSNTLDRSMKRCMADIAAITGSAPLLVRPPFWSYSERTREVYRQNGLHMLLSDIKANDGVIRIFKVSFRRRSQIRAELHEVKSAIERGMLPMVDGVIPVVVTFHDVNTFTANRFTEYLHLLIDESSQLGLSPSPVPFYDDRSDVERIALRRSET